MSLIHTYNTIHITEPDFRDDLDNRNDDFVFYEIDGTCTMHDFCEDGLDDLDCDICCNKPCYVRLPDSEIGKPITYDSSDY